MLYTIVDKSNTAHHLLGFKFQCEGEDGESQTFYSSEFERLGFPDAAIGKKFDYKVHPVTDKETLTVVK